MNTVQEKCVIRNKKHKDNGHNQSRVMESFTQIFCHVTENRRLSELLPEGGIVILLFPTFKELTPVFMKSDIGTGFTH